MLAGLGSAVHSPTAGANEGNETADPHVWLDPVLYRRVAGIVADALEQSDDAGGPHLEGPPDRTAAAKFEDRVDRLDAEYRDGLADCDSDLIVTTHAAFGYLADRYGLRQEPITGLSPEGEPDPARLADIEDLIRREHVTTVFTEPLVSSDVADTIARETGVQVAVLDPIESLTQPNSATGATTTSRSCGRTWTRSWRRSGVRTGPHDGGRKPRAGR